jgi:hypothetical protein
MRARQRSVIVGESMSILQKAQGTEGGTPN